MPSVPLSPPIPAPVLAPVLSPGAALKYLQGYSPALQQQALQLLAEGRLGPLLARRYAEAHEVRSDKALFDYTQDLKQRFMRNAPPLNSVAYDAKLKVIQHALGTHTRRSQQQGSRLKSRREIRIASLFREAPADFLRMIVVHELAHIREPEHDKAFYQLCQHMAPGYGQLELDLRLWLTQREFEPAASAAPAA